MEYLWKSIFFISKLSFLNTMNLKRIVVFFFGVLFWGRCPYLW